MDAHENGRGGFRTIRLCRRRGNSLPHRIVSAGIRAGLLAKIQYPACSRFQDSRQLFLPHRSLLRPRPAPHHRSRMRKKRNHPGLITPPLKRAAVRIGEGNADRRTLHATYPFSLEIICYSTATVLSFAPLGSKWGHSSPKSSCSKRKKTQ